MYVYLVKKEIFRYYKIILIKQKRRGTFVMAEFISDYFNKNFVVNFLTKKEFFLVGVITACIFFIKLNLIFLPFFSIICICIEEFLKKNYKNILNVLVYFSLGVFFLSLIFIIYFVINDNFNDFFYL